MQKIYFKGYVTKGEKENEYRVLASTSVVDRMGDSIDQTGWELDNFMKNPVMPWAHKYDELPIAKVTSIENTERGLEASFQFAPAEGNPKAQQVKVLYDEGYLNAVSVGFIPKERNGNCITKAELLEISFVPVPANQEALKLAMKSLDVSLLPEIEKGAVADEVNAEEMGEQKWEKWCEVTDILSAFWSVYFDENTPVEDFQKLLTEVIVLLQEVAKTDGVDADEQSTMQDAIKRAMTEESTKNFIEFLIKSGRTLSAKTLENIDNAIASMKTATTVLEQLKADSSADEKQNGKTEVKTGDEHIEGDEDPEELEEKGLELKSEDLVLIRQTLVAKDKSNELALSIVNAKLREMGLLK